jgi:hypothetical protein
MAMQFVREAFWLFYVAICVVAACALFVGEAAGQTDPTSAARAEVAEAQQPVQPQDAGTIRGVVADKTTTAVVGATITLTRPDSSAVQQTTTDENGQYAFGRVAPGPFNIAISAPGFAAQAVIGELHAGEAYTVPAVTLVISTVTTEVDVTMSHVEIAEAQIKEEEKQRVLGFVPNYYVSYVPDAASLNTKQKFELAWKTTINPITFALTGAAAGVEQMQDQYGGYGQGAQGYGKRYGATYADVVTGNFIGAALLPSLFKQDPRYFYKGTGSKKSRVLYALANSFITKGDNGKWQANYSGLVGSLAAGGISNLYYPASDRGAGLTFENVAITIAAGSAANILQEFLIRKLTPNTNSTGPHP